MKYASYQRVAEVAREVMAKGPMALATNFGSSLSGPDGGYAVPTDFANTVLMPEVGALLPYCAQIPVTQGGGIRVPKDIDTALAATSSNEARWEGEGDQHTQDKPNIELNEFRLKKLIVLVPVSESLLEDSAALAAWLPLAMQTASRRKINDAIVNGLGLGMPLGILKSSALVTVAKDGAQTADTINAANVKAMLDRSLNPDGSMWVMNPSAYSQVVELSSFDSASKTLAGLPILTTDVCPAVGDVGDIILADMSRYLVALKTPQLNMSMHLWFDQDMTAFKLTFRMDGMPMLAEPITPPNSGTTKSHFVAVAARA